MSDDQVLIISTTVTFSLLELFTLVLRAKFLKEINKKTTYKTIKKNFLLFVSIVLAHCQFIQIVKQCLQKHFVLYFLYIFVLSYLNYKKNNKRQTYKDLFCSGRILLRCLNVPPQCTPICTTRYINNIKQEKKRPEIKNSEVSEDY